LTECSLNLQETPDTEGNIIRNRHVSLATKDIAQFLLGVLQVSRPRMRKILTGAVDVTTSTMADWYGVRRLLRSAERFRE